jgi:hypothetical protein
MEAAAAAAAELLEGELEFELSSSSCAMQSEDSEGPSCYWLDGTEEDNAGEESDCDMEKPPVEEFSLCELDAADTRAIEVGGDRPPGMTAAGTAVLLAGGGSSSSSPMS